MLNVANTVNLSPEILRGSKYEKSFAALKHCAPAPVDFAGWRSVCEGAALCLRTLVDEYPDASDDVVSLCEEYEGLVQQVQFAPLSVLAEPAFSVHRRLTKYPQWAALSIAAVRQDEIYRLGLGLFLLQALRSKAKLAKKAVDDLRRDKGSVTSIGLLKQLFELSRQDVRDRPHWVRELNKFWSEAVGVLTHATPVPRSIQIAEKQQNNLLYHAVYASPKHRAGVLDHRHLSVDEIVEIGPLLEGALQHPNSDVSAPAACAMLCWQFQFPLSALRDVPLYQEGAPNGIASLDLKRGVWVTDISSVARDQAKQIDEEGHIPAQMICVKPLSQSLHRYLRSRWEPSIKDIAGLIPQVCDLLAGNPIVSSQREIKQSYARWTNSAGGYFRHLGIDTLIAALLSNDFMMIPRSKLYYTSVTPEELWLASAQIFQSLRWGEPVEMPPDLKPVGAQVVPTPERMKAVGVVIRQGIDRARPSTQCELEHLVNFHNRYSSAVLWCLAFAVSARRIKEVRWTASMLTPKVDALVLEDKGKGGLPVPLGAFARQLLDNYRLHLVALEARLHSHEKCMSKNVLSWLEQVRAYGHVPLFQQISTTGQRSFLSTLSMVNEFPDVPKIAPDSGRKFWETHLRHAGVLSTDIDAMARHEVLGQERFSTAADFCLSDTLDRLRTSIDPCLHELFGTPWHGLRKPSKGARYD